jgi:hypothetical protein
VKRLVLACLSAAATPPPRGLIEAQIASGAPMTQAVEQAAAGPSDSFFAPGESWGDGS